MGEWRTLPRMLNVGLMLLVPGVIFVGLGIFCFVTKTIPTRRRVGKTILAYPFGVAFFAGAAFSFYLGGSVILDGATLVGSCNQRDVASQCLELREGTLAAVAECATGVVSANGCPKDSVYGRCAFTGPSRTLYVYHGGAPRDFASEPARCAAQGGVWAVGRD